MWSDEDFTRSGGFDVSGYDSPTASTNAAETKTSKRPTSIVPVAIKQILDAGDVLQVAGLPVTMMMVVGIVKEINVTSTRISYTIQDWSGTITGMQWLESDEQKPSGIVENTYVKVSGTKRTQENKSVLFIYNIVPVENMSEIAYHYLQIIYIPLKAEETKNQGSGDAVTNDGLNLPPAHSKVYNTIRGAKSEAGMNKTEILQLLKMPASELEKIIEFLITEGHIYCTTDDDHFRVTDS